MRKIVYIHWGGLLLYSFPMKSPVCKFEQCFRFLLHICLLVHVEFINLQHIPITNAIELLNKTDGSPGSIQKMIDDAISELDVADLQQEETIYLFGGSASELV